jgi:hypothetical protein
MATIESRLVNLENKQCCCKPVFKDTFAEFPAVGNENRIYIDRSTGDIYVWDGASYITSDGSTTHTNSTQGAPYTGTELPILDGTTVGDTQTVSFNNGYVVDYTWDGAVWVLDFATGEQDLTPYLLLEGREGGQTAIGGTGVADALTLQGTTNNGTTTAKALIVKVGNAGGTEAISVLNSGNSVFGTVAASTATATPLNVSFGSTFGSNTAGSVGNLKWDLFTSVSTGSRYGIGMSALLMEFQSGTGGGHGFFVDQGVSAMRITSTGNVGISVTTPTAARLEVSGASLTGSASTGILNLTQTWNTTGSPTAILLNVTNTASGASANLMDLQVGGATAFKIRKDGRLYMGSADVGISPVDTSGVTSFSGTNAAINFSSDNESGFGLYVRSVAAIERTSTSGESGVINLNNGFSPTSGTGTFTGILFRATFNQTGGANGITRGIHINPTLTSAADWRAIESTGKVIFAGETLTGSAASSLLSMSQTWNTTGSPTAILLNVTNTASGSSANLMDLQVNGSSVFKVDKTGAGTFVNTMKATDLHIALGSNVVRLLASANGVGYLSNAALTDFNRLCWGGTTSSFPSLKRSTTGLIVRLADDSADAPITALTVKASQAAGYISSDGSTGATGSFTTADLKTVTVKDGIITSIV